MADHKHWMKLALKEARKGLGVTYPNPPVGAVVVRDGRMIGKGYHHKAGLAHAEVEALASCTESPEGADLYVTLEPCSTQGRTGACTDAIVKHGLKRVFYGAADPTLANAGGAKTSLEKHGIEVVGGVEDELCRELLEPFAAYHRRQRPWVTAKAAISLDGRIACASGDSSWISCQASRRYVHQLRQTIDAILVGETTFLKDNPRLNARVKDTVVHTPLRIVLCSKSHLPEDYHLFTESPEKTLVVSDRPILSETLKQAGVQEWHYRSRSTCLQELMEELHRRQIVHLMVEGGGQTLARFADAQLIDDVYLFVAPKVIGEGPLWLPKLSDPAVSMQDAIALTNVRYQRKGIDTVVYGRWPKEDGDV